MDHVQLHFFAHHIKEAAEEKKKKKGLSSTQRAALLGGLLSLSVGAGTLRKVKKAKKTNQLMSKSKAPSKPSTSIKDRLYDLAEDAHFFV